MELNIRIKLVLQMVAIKLGQKVLQLSSGGLMAETNHLTVLGMIQLQLGASAGF